MPAPNPPSSKNLHVLAGHLTTGALLGILLACTDGVIAMVRAWDTLQPTGIGDLTKTFLSLGFHLTALYSPVICVVACILGTVDLSLRATPWLQPALRVLQSRAEWKRSRPELWATGMALLMSSGLWCVTAVPVSEHFATAYHNPQMAAVTLTVTLASLAVALFLFAMIIGVPLRWFTQGFSKHASLATLTGLLAVLLIIATILLAPKLTWIADAIDSMALIVMPIAVILYPIGPWIWLRAFAPQTHAHSPPKRPHANSKAWLGTLVPLMWVAGTWLVSANTYGPNNHLRHLLEHRAVAGHTALRLHLTLTDKDRDEFSSWFGGGDCDDSNPNVYPGALDAPGDGVDADCFDGDGSRDVAELSTGNYGTSPLATKPNILLVTVDALRRDHLGCMGHSRKVTPYLDSLCNASTRFHQVVAPSSRSIRSIPAMFTGNYPSQIAYGTEYLYPALLEENRTLPEVLQAHGYNTGVVMGTDYFTRVRGFFQGFKHVVQLQNYKPNRRRAVDRAVQLFQRKINPDQPWFLWVHLFHVHEPYLWDGKLSAFGDDADGKYDTELQIADQEIQRLVGHVKTHSDPNRLVTVIASDHGEAFGEHGTYGHCYTLYDEELRATLLIETPGVEPRDVHAPVGLQDLTPTLLNLAKLPMPAATPSRSLVPLMTGESQRLSREHLYAELVPDGLFPYDQKAVYKDNLKLIWWVKDGTHRLFDLAQDPKEQRDLSRDSPGLAEEMLGVLRAWTSQTHRSENQRRRYVQAHRLSEPPVHMTHPQEFVYPGKFTFLGFDLPKTTYQPGERIPMTFYYRVDNHIEKDLFFFLRFQGPEGYRLPRDFHAYHYPLRGRYRTTEWKPGEILRDQVELIVPQRIRTPLDLKLLWTVLKRQRYDVPTSTGQRSIHLADIQIR